MGNVEKINFKEERKNNERKTMRWGYMKKDMENHEKWNLNLKMANFDSGDWENETKRVKWTENPGMNMSWRRGYRRSNTVKEKSWLKYLGLRVRDSLKRKVSRSCWI